MKKKGLVILLVAGVMAASAAMPAFALDLQQYYGQDSTEIRTGYSYELNQEYRFCSGHKNKIPGWAWIDGYCYYFTNKNMRDKITNGTTPDGYTVDDQGRWTVDGVVQYNGYGSLQVGTDALYAGKDDDARWLAMRGYLEGMLAEKWNADTDEVSFVSYDNSILLNWPNRSGHIIHDGQNGNPYVTLWLGNSWNDSPEAYWNYKSEQNELLIKAICGDHAGQELFDAIRKAAEPAEGGAYQEPIYDENGEWIMYKDPESGFTKLKVVDRATSGDGINFNYIDMAKWGSGQMKTDYGKSIYLSTGPNINNDKASQTPTEWIVEIK